MRSGKRREAHRGWLDEEVQYKRRENERHYSHGPTLFKGTVLGSFVR